MKEKDFPLDLLFDIEEKATACQIKIASERRGEKTDNRTGPGHLLHQSCSSQIITLPYKREGGLLRIRMEKSPVGEKKAH